MGFPDLARAQAAVQRVFPILDRTPPIDAADPGGERPASVAGGLELQAVTFVYVSSPGGSRCFPGRRRPFGSRAGLALGGTVGKGAACSPGPRRPAARAHLFSGFESAGDPILARLRPLPHKTQPSRPSVVVLSNFSLRIPAGKTVALVGESGAGSAAAPTLGRDPAAPFSARTIV
jgi:ABC-type multidrug transport system fused ATPase/permease subunit